MHEPFITDGVTDCGMPFVGDGMKEAEGDDLFAEDVVDVFSEALLIHGSRFEFLDVALES